MLLEVKFRVKGTETMQTRAPLHWAVESKTTDHNAIAHALSTDNRWIGEAHPPENFVIEEVKVL